MTDINNILNTFCNILRKAIDSEYFKQPIPSEIDDKINEILVMFCAYNQVQMKSIINGIVGDSARVLGLFAERMASLSVRENYILRVKQGLLGLIIYSSTVDPRDVLTVLSLLHDAANKITGNPKDIFKEVTSIYIDADFLIDFLNRSDEDKSIDAMGYEESKCEEGFVYKRTW